MDKENVALLRVREAARDAERVYKRPLVVAVSGGVNSAICLHLAKRLDIKFEATHTMRPDSPKEEVFAVDLLFDALEHGGIKCYYGSEKGSLFRRQFVCTGVRWSNATGTERGRGSAIHPYENDSRRRAFERCSNHDRMTVNPIIDWTDADVRSYTQKHIVFA